MAAAKRQGREKPVKIEQKKVWSEDLSKTNNTPGWPNLHRTGLGRDKHINRGAQTSLLSLSPVHWGTLLLVSLDLRALTPQRWIFLLSSK